LISLSFDEHRQYPSTVPIIDAPEDVAEATIIIPTRDRLDLLRPCVDSILTQTDGRYRIIIVDNGSQDPATLDYFTRLNAEVRVEFLSMPGPFNFSRLCNAAAARVASGVLVFLNNDTVVIQRDWLQKLIRPAQDHAVGAVGAKLIYPNGKVQHAGVIAGLGGQAGHFELGIDSGDAGYFGRGHVTHRLSAVTGACLAVEAVKFHMIGGFDEVNLPIDLNDIDLCFRLLQRGYCTLYVPSAVLVHHESASRGHIDNSEDAYSRERSYFRKRWLHIMRADRHFSLALSLYANRAMLG